MKKKVYIIVFTVLIILGGIALYCAMPKYVVYAVIPSNDGPKCEVAYKSISHDKAKAQHLYLNGHKKEGVKHYILVDEETGNSVIPF